MLDGPAAIHMRKGNLKMKKLAVWFNALKYWIGLAVIVFSPEVIHGQGNYVYDGCDYSRAWGYTGNSTNGPAYVYGTAPSYGYYTGNYSEGHSNISPQPFGEVTVPSYFDEHPVVSINQYSYYKCSNITDVTIPPGVTYIGEAAFSGCSSMTNISIPKSVTYIGDWTFSGCSSLKNIEIPSSITYIGTNGFSGCELLTEIVVPNSVTTIRDSAFSHCSGLRRVVLPQNLAEIPAYAFSYCTNLSEIVIPETVTNIGRYAFRGCKNLKSITLPQAITRIEEGVFAGCGSFRITFPNGLKEIGGGAFLGCLWLDDFVLPEGLEEIGIGAFAGCGLWNDQDYIVIPKTVEHIGAGAFCEAYMLGIMIQNGVIGESAFANSSVREVILSNGVVAIESMAFRGCDELTEISIPASVSFIGERAFYGQGDTGWEEKYYDFISDNLNQYCGSGYGYFEDSFRGCTSLTNIVLGGDTVEAIKDERVVYDWLLFNGGIEILPLGVGIIVGGMTVGDEAFGHCENLLDVTIGANVRVIYDNVFNGCCKLRNLKLEEAPINLISATVSTGPYGEDLVTCITNVIPELNIGNTAFANCRDLKSVSIPNRVKSIGDSAFSNCRTLTNVTFRGNAPNMGNSAFSSVDSGCVAYVGRDSTGWGVDIPGTWNGLQIEYYDPTPIQQTHTVSFDLGDHGIRIGGGELTQAVTNGCAAVAPEVMSTDGWAFTGWSATFTNVTANLTIVAQYERLPERVDYYVCGGGYSLQHVIDLATNGSTILVGDGTYGPIDTADKTLTIRSVNGAERTIIEGEGGRCALLGIIADNGDPCSVFDLFVKSFGATLEGFTLKRGSKCMPDYLVDAFGGGAAGGILLDCKIVDCTAYLGGGAFQSDLIRCEIRSCRADSYDYFNNASMHTALGGGANDCKLDNCIVHWCSADGDAGGVINCDVYSSTIVDNELWPLYATVCTNDMIISAGGCCSGANFCNVSNSVIYGNWMIVALVDDDMVPVCDEYGCQEFSDVQSNWSYISDLSNNGFFANSCTYPMPPNNRLVVNNITNDPQFVDAEHGNYRLLPTSPCIDAAGWAATNAMIDLDGKPRVSGTAPDIGAYEYQNVVVPIPELAITATPAEVAAALSGSVDEDLAVNVTNATQYAAYREWALAVKDVDGISVAGAQMVKDSSRAWLSFALGADKLVPDVLTSEDIKIESIKPMGVDGIFALEVSIANVGIGCGVTITDANREAIMENMKKVLDVEGAARLDESEFSSSNVETTFDIPMDGKVRFRVRRRAGNNATWHVATSFFMRVKVQ